MTFIDYFTTCKMIFIIKQIRDYLEIHKMADYIHLEEFLKLGHEVYELRQECYEQKQEIIKLKTQIRTGKIGMTEEEIKATLKQCCFGVYTKNDSYVFIWGINDCRNCECVSYVCNFRKEEKCRYGGLWSIIRCYEDNGCLHLAIDKNKGLLVDIPLHEICDFSRISKNGRDDEIATVKEIMTELTSSSCFFDCELNHLFDCDW